MLPSRRSGRTARVARAGLRRLTGTRSRFSRVGGRRSARPASDLATRTIAKLTGGAIASDFSLKLLAAWEVLIGLGLLTGRLLRITLLMLFLQMAGTVLPLFFFPDETWRAFPYAPTLEGQYIIKNLVLISAGLVLGGTVRGGTLVAEAQPRKAV